MKIFGIIRLYDKKQFEPEKLVQTSLNSFLAAPALLEVLKHLEALKSSFEQFSHQATLPAIIRMDGSTKCIKNWKLFEMHFKNGKVNKELSSTTKYCTR